MNLNLNCDLIFSGALGLNCIASERFDEFITNFEEMQDCDMSKSNIPPPVPLEGPKVDPLNRSRNGKSKFQKLDCFSSFFSLIRDGP